MPVRCCRLRPVDSIASIAIIRLRRAKRLDLVLLNHQLDLAVAVGSPVIDPHGVLVVVHLVDSRSRGIVAAGLETSRVGVALVLVGGGAVVAPAEDGAEDWLAEWEVADDDGDARLGAVPVEEDI
jgi:hypothetical protein